MPTPFVPAAATVLAELRYSYFSQRCENTLWFRDTLDNITTPGMLQLAADLQTWWGADIAPLVSNAVTLEEITVTDMSSATAPSVSLTAGEVGDLVSAGMPGNVTATITFKTAQRGKSSRGRNYLVGLTEGQITGNAINAGVLDSFQTAYAGMVASFTPGVSVWEHVVASRISGGVPRTNAFIQPVLSYVITDNNVDSQRRRLTGRGL